MSSLCISKGSSTLHSRLISHRNPKKRPGLCLKRNLASSKVCSLMKMITTRCARLANSTRSLWKSLQKSGRNLTHPLERLLSSGSRNCKRCSRPRWALRRRSKKYQRCGVPYNENRKSSSSSRTACNRSSNPRYRIVSPLFLRRLQFSQHLLLTLKCITNRIQLWQNSSSIVIQRKVRKPQLREAYRLKHQLRKLRPTPGKHRLSSKLPFLPEIRIISNTSISEWRSSQTKKWSRLTSRRPSGKIGLRWVRISASNTSQI